MLDRFVNVDYDDRMALVAEHAGHLVAVARYDRLDPPSEAEAAFVVEDSWQGRGLGTLLVEHLAAVAREHGITRLVAHTLPHNEKMLGVFRDAGFVRRSEFADGTVRVTLDIEATAASVEASDERDRTAAVRSIARVLEPRSIAVVGASTRAGTIGHEIFRNLLTGGFEGPVYPVHPTAAHISSVRAYPTVLDIPDAVDLAVVVVPAQAVLDIVDQCGAKLVHALVIISAGFAETGPDGRNLEREVVQRARVHGMRIVGPNCMGVINATKGVRMNATFAPVTPPLGRVAFSSQSGALGIAILRAAADLGLGISSFVSVGNKADVSGNDLLRYWEADTNTDVILLYLESFGNPRKFSRIARRVSRAKPIVAVKSGRTPAGSRAASSHTAALMSSETAVDALFRQTGVIRVDTLEQLFDVAQVLSLQPLPAGRRVAIVSNAGGPGILAADACEQAGLLVPELSVVTQQHLRVFLPPVATVTNPIDLIASAGADEYRQALDLLVADEGVDAVLALFVPPLVTRPEDVASAIGHVARSPDHDKPIIANFLAMGALPDSLASVPTFAYPETAVQALARVVSYAEWRERPPGEVPELDGIDRAAASTVIEGVLTADKAGRWLGPVEAVELLTAYGIPVVATVPCRSPADAMAAASQLGYPVAMKTADGDVVHKTDVGAVRLDLRSDADVERSFAVITAAVGGTAGVLVQPMAQRGVETIVGLVQDPAFGPLIMFGTGGTSVELLQDQSFRILPLTDVDARELVRSTRGSALLFGYRGGEPADTDALEHLLMRVGLLAEAHPEVAEIDLNPVLVSPAGALVVDAKVRVAPYERHPELAVRRLR
jgi:acetyl coenzyme A synthetase (ADP forming)-like protein